MTNPIETDDQIEPVDLNEHLDEIIEAFESLRRRAQKAEARLDAFDTVFRAMAPHLLDAMRGAGYVQLHPRKGDIS